MHTIKPIDKNFLKGIFKKFKYIVILEEHSKIGGLASAIYEVYSSSNNKNKFLSLNTGENFVERSGKQKFAFEKLQISSKHIYKKILRFIKR